ncbi:pyridoxal kinase PdxY [Nakamurella flavida]|uniref:pyridoxal kinase n=1 Tax=Nakamurella flavida TaxID=363630 RepID=A0A938YK82_9ACTN|nr:pyridoxal kinase PdxY [Nakamurella flavida]MBM9476694.1 pyridoxal kinase PdxY [Nakamurella flavida]MDP9778868.1 pyridoxine kinase [Nakamurella flavida]
MRILSIQSSVAYGHVGNSAATFPLQRLGHEVWPVNTVHFSNHTGYGAWRGEVMAPEVVGDVIRGIDERGALGDVDAVLTGYQGSPGVAEVVLDTVERVRELNAAALYCCDPVLGDVGRGMFVLPGIPELMRDRVVPVADVVTPNAYELAFLAADPEFTAGGREARMPATLDEVLAAVEVVRGSGPSTVLVTSVEQGATDDEIAMLAVDSTGAYRVRTPRLPLSVNGAGDVTAALFLAHLSAGIDTALARVASSVFAILTATHRAGAREIRLVHAQSAIADPLGEFPVERLA